MKLGLVAFVWIALTCATTVMGQQGGAVDSSNATNNTSNTSKKQAIAPVQTTVIVTATRSEAEMDKVPASTSVIPEAEIQSRNITLIDQSLNLLPGIILTRTKGMADSMPAIGIRGFGGSGSSQSRTLIMLDGEPLNDGYTGQVLLTTIPTSEIERVEVVRGPYSALYGGNAMGGVVNILTHPVDQRNFELNSQFGSQNTGNYSANYSERFLGKLGISAGYQRGQTVGYPSTLTTKTASTGTSGTLVTGAQTTVTTAGSQTFIIGDSGHNWYNQDGVRARAEYAFSNKTTAFLQYIRQQDFYGYGRYHSYLEDANGKTINSGTVHFAVNGVSKQMTVTPVTFMPSGPGGTGSNFFQTRIIHSISKHQMVEASGGLVDQPLSWYSTPGSAADFGTGAGTTSSTPSRSWHANAMWSLADSVAGNLLFGSEFKRASAEAGTYSLSSYIDRNTKTAQTYMASGKSNNFALYGQEQYNITKRLLVTAGGRFDHWATMDGKSNSFDATGQVSYADRSENAYNGKLAALYQFKSGTTLRASIGNAFRNPPVYNLYRTWTSSSGILYKSNPSLDPEKLFSWEAGIRQTLGLNVQAEATYFENRVSNLIYSATDYSVDSTGKTIVQRNAGKALTRGAEFSAKDRLASWLELSLSYTYNNAVITENASIPATVGKQVTRVPRNAAAGMLSASKGRWSGSLTERFVGHVHSTDQNTDVRWGVPGAYDGYWLAGGALNYQVSKHFTVYGSVDNLLDRYYYQYYISPGRTTIGGVRFHL
jgi:iron complex outermembrane recepter protein